MRSRMPASVIGYCSIRSSSRVFVCCQPGHGQYICSRANRKSERTAGTTSDTGSKYMRRKKWTDDPLVPISGERLQQALAMAGVSLPQLAVRIREKRQTLDYIVRGKTS